MSIALIAIIIFLYAIFGVIGAVVMGMILANENLTGESPLEYWLMIFLSFAIWPFFFIQAIVETIKINSIKKKQNTWIRVNYGKGLVHKCEHCGYEIDISKIAPKYCPKCGMKNGRR